MPEGDKYDVISRLQLDMAKLKKKSKAGGGDGSGEGKHKGGTTGAGEATCSSCCIPKCTDHGGPGCFAAGKKVIKCQGKNHFQRSAKCPKKKTVAKVEEGSSDTDSEDCLRKIREDKVGVKATHKPLLFQSTGLIPTDYSRQTRETAATSGWSTTRLARTSS